MRTTEMALQMHAETELNQYIKDVYLTRGGKLPFEQYKVIRETFFAGMIKGNTILLEMEKLTGRPLQEGDVRTIMQTLGTLALDTAKGNLPVILPEYVMRGAL